MIEPPPATAAASGYRLDDQIGHLLRRTSQQASANLAERLADPDMPRIFTDEDFSQIVDK